MTTTTLPAPGGPARPPGDAATSVHDGPVLLVSGEAVALDIPVARISSRALALMIDILVQFLLLVALAIISFIALLELGAGADDALAQALLVCCLVVTLVGYPTAMETLWRGRTLGKRALGLRVVRDDGGPVRFRHALTRSLVGLALEWPGLLIPPLTWAAGLSTMLVNARGKRLGDLAAGTMVVHERSVAAWGWVPSMPPQLAGWARLLDLTGLDDDLALAVRHFLSRNRQLHPDARARLGQALAAEVAARTGPPPPPGVPGWAYLAAVTAERHRRAVLRLNQARAVSAAVWPELVPPAVPAAADQPNSVRPQ